MKETQFIKQNKDKWLEFEKELKHPNKNPEKLSNLFVQITDDLSYSRTFYRFRSVRVYLNNVSQKVFHSIYKNRSTKKQRFVNFWKEELPQIMWESRRAMTLSLIIFLLSAAIGVFCCIHNPDFPRLILGDYYVSMTLENIQKGDPMAVYKGQRQDFMMLGITFNNIMVAVRTFIMGIFYAIGTIAIMIYNGIMVGTFQYFFVQHGLFLKSALSIWLHGTLEISSIIIAGGAGITFGIGLVFPGTYTRMQSFRLSSRRAIKIMLGIAPVITFAAFIESFITRYTGFPDILKALLILVSAAFIFGYFIWLPYKRSRKGFSKPIEDGKLPESVEEKLELTEVKNNGEIMQHTFGLFRVFFSKLFWFVFSFSVLAAILCGYLLSDNLKFEFSLNTGNFFDTIANIFTSFIDLVQYFSYGRFPLLAIVNGLMYSATAFLTVYFIKKQIEPNQKRNTAYWIKIFTKSFLAGIVSTLFAYASPEACVWFIFLLMPVYMHWYCSSVFEKNSLFSSFGKGFSFGLVFFARAYGLHVINIIICFLFMVVLSSEYITWFIFEVINWNINLSPEQYRKFFVGFFSFLNYIGLNFALSIYIVSFTLQHFSITEIRTATGLKNKIAKMKLPTVKNTSQNAA